LPPLLDLGAQHAPLRAEIDAAIARVIDTSSLIGGAELEAFETEFAAFLGCRRAVGVASGTDALRLALIACGVGPGDEVITSAVSFVATAAAILAVGATPVLVDPDPASGLLEAPSAAAAITARTAALLPVHLYGQCIDLHAFAELAERHGLALIEDACQAHGATRDGLAAGTVGDAAAFSFYPGKNLGALGDAGALTTNRDELAERVARLRDHGRSERYLHLEVGATARLDALQAAVLRVKLRRLADWNSARREHARAYDAVFDELGIEHVAAVAGSVFHQYVLLDDERDRLAGGLAARGVGTGVHYPLALHHQPALAGRVRAGGSLEGAESLTARCLSIPVYPELSAPERDQIVAAVAALQPTGVS
jgi:dTDP-4-amino-4,6-dideoxygalactose transaminase